MGSDEDRLLNEESDTPVEAVDGSRPTKKKRGKVPKRVLKAERERLKREQLNDLFTRMASILELCEQNNGKASLLNETIRLLKELMIQIQSLREENATLLSESHYVTAENNELKDENSALEVQIKNLQSELEERLGQSKPDLNVSPPECWQADMASHYAKCHLPQLPAADPLTQQPPILGPLYVIPINSDFQVFQKENTPAIAPVAVSKPHPRYPTSADSWPLHLLSKEPEARSLQHCRSNV